MAGIKRHDNRLGLWGWLGGGRWGIERYVYTLHRVTGLGILFYFILHILVTSMRVFGQEAWEATMAPTLLLRTTGTRVLGGAMVLAALHHARRPSPRPEVSVLDSTEIRLFSMRLHEQRRKPAFMIRLLLMIGLLTVGISPTPASPQASEDNSRAATFGDRVSSFENLETAKALGITIPESILLRADELIR